LTTVIMRNLTDLFPCSGLFPLSGHAPRLSIRAGHGRREDCLPLINGPANA
jgi:hypothetical protein